MNKLALMFIGFLVGFFLACILFYLDESNPSPALKAFVCEGKR